VSWPIRLLPERPEEPVVGDMWPGNPDHWIVSAEYERDWAGKRPPMIVKLPGGEEWCIDMPCRGGPGWTITGEPPRVTISPSINVPGRYHGWIRDGVLTDDCEGRSFPAEDAER
jgi:hypothetical protein